MAKPEEIPFLLTLLDDPSADIQKRVEAELFSFGPLLERLLAQKIEGLEPAIKEPLLSIYGDIRKKEFDKNWLKWMDMEQHEGALEYAFTQLAYLDHGYNHPPLSDLLDNLADEFQNTSQPYTVPNLMRFVFEDLDFKPPRQAYYNPSHSNLVHVIQYKEGIQISLSCLCILLAPRLGLRVKGLNIPGHFMAFSTNEEGTYNIYDCFQQGKSLSKQAVLNLKFTLSEQNKTLRQMEARPFEIILRVLRNIINARIHNDGPRPDDMYKRIFDHLVQALQDRGILLL